MNTKSEAIVSTVVLNIVDHDRSIDLSEKGEFILGRSGQEMTQGGSSNTSLGRIDIDLGSYGAYEMGASRRHAALYVGNQIVTLTDLGSTNGTRLNGNLLNQFTPHQLHDGDMITLGKFKLQVHIQLGNG
jgi:hypothetical protein